MRSHAPFSADEQLQALGTIAEELRETDLDVLAPGSAAVVLRTGQRSIVTKDLDVHPFPSDDVLDLWDGIEEAIQRLGGSVEWEPDGATITAHVPMAGRDLPVEFVLGRENFIEPEVLEDAMETAEKRERVLVPSWEHIVVMKAEAWFDRTGREQETYLRDLTDIRDWMEETGTSLQRGEVERLVELRPERKHREMMLTIGRIFENRMGSPHHG